MTLIEIRPHRWGWKVFEAPGVEPVFPEKDQAIDYAQTRACFRTGEIRPNLYSGVAPNTARTGKNSDDEDERKKFMPSPNPTDS